MDPKRYLGHKYPKYALQVNSSRAHSSYRKEICKMQNPTGVTEHYISIALFPQLHLQNPKKQNRPKKS